MTEAATKHEDLLTPDVLRDPYPLFARLREEQDQRFAAGRRTFRLYRYAEVAAVLRDPRFNTSGALPVLDRLFVAGQRGDQREAMLTAVAVRGDMLNYLDPPRQTAIRDLIRPFFTPGRLDALTSRITVIVRERVDAAVNRGDLDIVRDLARPLPPLVMTGVLGLPAGDWPRLARWANDFAVFSGSGRPDPVRNERAWRSSRELWSYLQPRLAARARDRRDDLLGALTAAKARGEISDRELFATVIVLIIGGNETTTGLIANGLLSLIQRPEAWTRLREQPGLIDTAVEEFARFDSPVQLATRVVREAAPVGSIVAPKGAVIECWIGAANRDPAAFAEPDRLMLDRSPNRHLAFGRGGHYCPGSHLGRLEARIAIRTVVEMFPRLRLREPVVEWERSVIFRCPAALPVVTDGAG